MAKTKEEILKILEKNYKETQVQELSVYDKVIEQHTAFTKDAKELDKERTAEFKKIDKDEKAEIERVKAQIADIEQKHQAHLADVETRKEAAQQLYTKELTESAQNEQGLLDGKQKEIDAINKSFDKALKELDKQLKLDLDASNKQILASQEKGAKDQASFEVKISDLKAKYEAKVVTLQEKQQHKLEKLLEVHAKKVESIQAAIVSEKESADKKAVLKQAVYEEELEEINEKITFEKDEFEQKFASIKDSAEKRIAVREKHLQRAISDNDQRSAKQHKKDIAKFKKEIEHDLAVLQKNYDQQSQVSAAYPIKFKKDYLEECANREREFVDFSQQKQLELDNLKIQLTFDQENTKLEYQKLLAEELDKFNNDYAQIREKQETVKSQQIQDEEQEKHTQELFQIEWDRATKTEQENHKDDLETKAKEQRVIQLHKVAEDDLAQNTLSDTLARLESEVEVAEVTLAHDKTEAKLKKQIKLHTFQDKRHQAHKNEFLAYQQQLAPLFNNRAKEILAYDELEINNRLALKLAFYNEEQKTLDKDYELLTAKVDTMYTEEATFFEAQIEDIAGSQKVELDAFVEEHEAKAVELKAKFESIDNRKDRKVAENEYNDFTRHYKEQRAQKEQQLQQSVGVYLNALNDAKDRKEKALRDLADLYNAGTARVNRFIDQVKADAQAELDNSQKHVNETGENINQFNLSAASRNQQQTDANNLYLQTQIQTENDKIKNANSILENSRELLHENLNAEIQKLSTARQQLLDKKADEVHAQEANLEAFKNQIEAAIEAIKVDANNRVSAQNSAFAQTSSNITTALNQELGQIRTALANQVSDFNQTLSTISKNIQTAKNLLESEQKRVKKEFDDRLKQEFTRILDDLQTKTKAI